MSDRVHMLPPLNAAILIGGASARMGSPKHLLCSSGRTWLDQTISVVSPRVQRVALVGRGELPAWSSNLARMDDAVGMRGPLAGIIAALRHDRGAAWLVVACDLPRLSDDALNWLIAQRRADLRAVIPALADGRPEPLLAIYEPAALELLESLAADGIDAPREAATRPGVLIPIPPVELHAAWTNVNTPDELAAFGG
jgi:molybdopterin-guanine dinucleotide biosynthesis protein A